MRRYIYCGEYEMELNYPDPMDPKGSAASIRVDHTYLNFTINIAPLIFDYYKSGNFKEIKKVIIHEFAHLLTEPIYAVAIDAVANGAKGFLEDIRERQTQRIAHILYDEISLKIFFKKSKIRTKYVT